MFGCYLSGISVFQGFIFNASLEVAIITQLGYFHWTGKTITMQALEGSELLSLGRRPHKETTIDP